MKALVITPWCCDLSLDEVKGTPENAYLMRELKEKGVVVKVLCPQVHGFPQLKKGKLSFVWERYYDGKIFGLIKNMEFDFAISITGIGALALKKTKKPFFIKYLGAFDYFLIPPLKRYVYQRRFLRGVKANPDVIVMTDDGTLGYDAVRHAGFKKDILFLRNGYMMELRGLERVPSEFLRVGFAASLELIKGVDFLIEIIKHFAPENHVFFKIAGDGTFKREIRNLGKKYRGIVEYMGYLKYSKMTEFYRNIDILLSLNRYANGTLPVVEAQAAGIPVVAFNVQDTAKFIKSNVSGFLVEPFNVQSIKFLLKTLKKKQIRGMYENTRAFALAAFIDMKKRAEKEVKFYMEHL